jgi:hypothetical protein
MVYVMLGQFKFSVDFEEESVTTYLGGCPLEYLISRVLTEAVRENGTGIFTPGANVYFKGLAFRLPSEELPKTTERDYLLEVLRRANLARAHFGLEPLTWTEQPRPIFTLGGANITVDSDGDVYLNGGLFFSAPQHIRRALAAKVLSSHDEDYDGFVEEYLSLLLKYHKEKGIRLEIKKDGVLLTTP